MLFYINKIHVKNIVLSTTDRDRPTTVVLEVRRIVGVRMPDGCQNVARVQPPLYLNNMKSRKFKYFLKILYFDIKDYGMLG